MDKPNFRIRNKDGEIFHREFINGLASAIWFDLIPRKVRIPSKKFNKLSEINRIFK